MALPIKQKPGYHQTVKSYKGNSWYGRIVWYDSRGVQWSQSQPWDRPLPYTRQQFWELSGTRTERAPEIPDVDYQLPAEAARLERLSYERAFDKLRNNLRGGHEGDLGVTLAQSHLTYRLYKDYLAKFVYFRKIGDLADTLDRFAFFTRKAAGAQGWRGRARWRRKAAKVLGVRPTTDREVRRRLNGQLLRTGVSSFSAEYLAFHYGWSPLFEEIYACLDLLSQGINYPGGFYQESGSGYTKSSELRGSIRYTFDFRVVTKLGCYAEVESELAYSLGVVGLANPAAVLWDIVPWSFVVDWVLSIGPRLQNQTAFLGVKFSKDYHTTYNSVTYTRRGPVAASESYTQTVEGYDVKRVVGSGFAPPPIRIKNPIGRDAGKALAQISLLAMFGLKPNSRSL